jgi:hypothetical protein
LINKIRAIQRLKKPLYLFCPFRLYFRGADHLPAAPTALPARFA